MSGLDALLEEQLSYYRARADEYDDWFVRRGRYDRGAEQNQRWFDEVEVVRARLDAVDAAPEVLQLNRDRLAAAGLSARVAYREADLFSWRSERQYPLVSFGFWLSHVPAEREPADLARRLADMGLRARVGATDDFFLYGAGGRA